MKKKQAGKIIRIGKELEHILDKKRAKNESYDSILRKCIGLDIKPGGPHSVPSLVFGCWIFVDNDVPVPFLTKAEAEGYAIQVAVRDGKKRTGRILKVQEVV